MYNGEWKGVYAAGSSKGRGEGKAKGNGKGSTQGTRKGQNGKQDSTDDFPYKYHSSGGSVHKAAQCFKERPRRLGYLCGRGSRSSEQSRSLGRTP